MASNDTRTARSSFVRASASLARISSYSAKSCSWKGSPVADAFIVDAVRTPVGKRGGALAAVHSADLAAHAITALMDRTGVLRDDLDVTLTYRFIRDTVWVAVRWYRPGRGHTHTEVADQYLTILLDGITA